MANMLYPVYQLLLIGSAFLEDFHEKNLKDELIEKKKAMIH